MDEPARALACLAVTTLIAGAATAQEFQNAQTQVTGLAWDEDGNPGDWSQVDLPQYKSACGDDPNEYLIREHSGNSDEFKGDGRDWVCADRPTDCALDEKVYSQGQAVNIGSAGEENGNAVAEPEVCLDDDPNVPGGEWYDLDDDRLTTDNLNSEQVGNLTRVHPDRPTLDRLWDNNPGTDRSRAPTGYATEDDCDPALQACDDDGDSFSSSAWFSAGAFTEGSRQDNNLNSNSFGGLHNKLQDSSNQFEPGAETIDSLEDSYDDTPWTNDRLDTTPGPDNWSLSDTLTDSVSNRGESLKQGMCHYRDSQDRRENLMDETVNKTQKYFGNSYANVTDRDGDGTEEGVWADPDNLSSSKTTFSCDLTRDRGIGYDKQNEDTFRENNKVYVGDIAFQGTSDENPAKGLEHPVCGDDESEIFIEAVGEAPDGTTRDGAYGCVNTTDFCAVGGGGPTELFRVGEYVNTNESTEAEGRFKDDRETCINPSDGEAVGNALHGIWYDQDYNRKACRTNALYGPPGIRWFDESYVDEYPYAVTGGIDDDYNQFLVNEGHSTLKANASLGETGGLEDGESPVESGTDNQEALTLGFCGGDDGSEYLASQVCRTDICVSDRSHLGVAKEPGSCVYDGRDIYTDVPQPVDDDKYKRTLYNSGENITLDYQQEQTITCVDGQWFEEGPVVFDRNEKNVSLGGEASASFRVINLGRLETEYEVTLNKDTEAERFSTIEDKASNTFSVSVPPKESRQFTLDISGRSEIPDSPGTTGDEITVTADAVNARTQGSDTLEIDLVDPGQTGSQRQEDNEQDRNIPGITAIEILLLLMLSTALYIRI
jgi:hypothetical protein